MLTLLPQPQDRASQPQGDSGRIPSRCPVWLYLWGGLASLSVACSTPIALRISPTAPVPAPESPPPSPSPAPVVAASPAPAPPPVAQTDPSQEAIGTATGAVNISRSAVSREDWRLAASRWERAIQLLQTVPGDHEQYAMTQQKISQYQQLLADAKLRGTPPPPPPASGDAAPPFFSAPIKWRAGGIPNQDARMLNLRPVATKQVAIADGSIVGLPIALVKSIDLDGRIKRNLTYSLT